MYEICRVCLIVSDEMISLKADDAESLMILHMLSEFTLKNTEEQLSKYICNNCTNILDMAYEFKRKYEDSIIKYIRQKNEVINLTEDQDCLEMTSKPHEDCVKDEDELTNELQSNFKVISCYSLQDEQSSVIKSISDHDTELQKTESEMCLSFDPHENVHEKMERKSNFTRNENEIQAITVQSNQHRYKSEDILEKHLNCEQNPDRPKQILQKYLYLNQDQSRAELVRNSNCDQHKVEEKVAHTNFNHREQSQVKLENSSWNLDEVQSPVQSSAKLVNFHEPESQPPLELVSFHEPETQPPVEFVITLKGHQMDQPHLKLLKRLNSEQHKDEPEAKLVRHSNRISALKINLSDRISPIELHEDKVIFPQKPRFTKVFSKKGERKMTNLILDKIYICHGSRHKPFLCDVCHRWFKTKGHIKTHRMLHIQAKREIKCVKCFLRFLTKPHFQKHKCLN